MYTKRTKIFEIAGVKMHSSHHHRPAVHRLCNKYNSQELQMRRSTQRIRELGRHMVGGFEVDQCLARRNALIAVDQRDAPIKW